MHDSPRLYSTAEAAAALGISAAQVRRVAATLEVGRRVGPRYLLFTDADLARMRQRKTRPGRERRLPHPIE